MNATPRERWSSQMGFTLAAVGSAVGLGNMWRFSYMAAENGGAAFVLLYLGMTLLLGLPVLLAELTLGRGARRSPIQALVHYGGRTWRPLGTLFVLTGAVILSYYGVIAGWTLRYALEAAWQGFPTEAGQHFNEVVASGWDAVAWHLVFLAACAVVVAGGVRRGIERAALVLMPLLALLVVGLAVYAAFQEGAGSGYAYYFRTDLARSLRMEVVQDAASQAFFSLSLGMGAILTYASYLERQHDLPRETLLIAVSDFSVAFVAGLVIFPLLFALGLEAQVMGGGTGTVGALFVVLPQAFASMGVAGTVVGLLFFLALLVGALTSAVSLLEVVVSSAMDGLGIERRRAAWLCAIGVAALGVPSALSLSVLGLMDQIGGNLFLVLGGLFLAVFVGWVMPDAIQEAATGGRRRGLRLWRALLRTVVPAVLLFVLLHAARKTWTLLVGG